MTYLDGFVIACAEEKKQDFIDHAKLADPFFMEHGAIRVVECWADDVPEGKTTGFRMAVKAEPGEAVLFSYIEWPDKATRDACFAKMMDGNLDDPRMDPAKNPMPFDGKRMIFGGFDTIVDERGSGAPGYTDGYVVPVPADKRQAYRDLAQLMAGKFTQWGAVRVVEAWSDDVPVGKLTDFHRAVKAEDGEAIVFSYVEWPDKQTRDAGWAKMMAEDPAPDMPMPFDGKRMIWGGFLPVVDLVGEPA